MKTLAFTAAIAALSLAAVSTAGARPDCDDFACGSNGPQLVGIAQPAVKAQQPIIEAVTLPSGGRVDLR